MALAELQKFIKTYPQSEYNTEAKDLLVSVLANTSNYQEALTLIDQIPNPSAAAKAVYPRILFARPSELITMAIWLKPTLYLPKPEQQPNNASVLPIVQFWKGEIAYRTKHIPDDAIRYYFDYLKSGATSGEATPVNAKYNLGYCFLKKENYNQALGFLVRY